MVGVKSNYSKQTFYILSSESIFYCLLDGQISFSGRIQILEDGSLLIAKVRSTDRGKYTCVRANEAGSVRGTAWVSVLVRTQIIQVNLNDFYQWQ